MSEKIKVGDWVKCIGTKGNGYIKIGNRFLVEEFLGDFLGIKGCAILVLTRNFKKCSPPEQENPEIKICDRCGEHGHIRCYPHIEKEANPWLPASEMAEGVEYEGHLRDGFDYYRVITGEDGYKRMQIKSEYDQWKWIKRWEAHQLYTEAKFRRLDNAKT